MKRHCVPSLHRSAHVHILAGLGVVTIAGCLDGASAGSPGEESAAVAAVSADSALDADYLPVPHIGRAHKSCVHALAAHDVVDAQGAIHSANGRVQPAAAACGYPVKPSHDSASLTPVNSGLVPTDNGWTEYASWTSPIAMRAFGATFHVPAAPTLYTGQTIFFFPAMQSLGSSPSIIQPVLQYGPSAAGGGAYWAIASWIGGGAYGGNFYYTALRPVSTGEEIRGGMYQTNNCNASGACEWDVAMHDTNNGSDLVLGSVLGFAWQWVVAGAIEVYGIDDCRKYPATYDNFYDFYLQDGNYNNPTPQWGATISVSTCAERVALSTNLVELHYGSN